MSNNLLKFRIALRKSWCEFIDILVAVVFRPVLVVKYFYIFTFNTLFVVAGAIFFAVSFKGLSNIWHALESPDHSTVEKEIIHGIEFIFISPIPFLIISALKNYYDNIVGFSIYKKKTTDPHLDKSRLNALSDLTLVKYLFVSILVSTVFTVIIELIFEIDRSEPKSMDAFILHSLSYLPKLLISIVLLVVLLLYVGVIKKHLPEQHKDQSNS